jgi:hypothetical protein
MNASKQGEVICVDQWFARGRHSTIEGFIPFTQKPLDEGLKYLGFVLKPNDNLFKNRLWLFIKVRKRIYFWAHPWLSRSERLVLFNVVLSSIPVYWASIAKIPKGIKSKIRKLCF